MTVRFTKYWQGMHPGTTATYSERKERQLVRDGFAEDVKSIGPSRIVSWVTLSPADAADAQARLTSALARYN